MELGEVGVGDPFHLESSSRGGEQGREGGTEGKARSKVCNLGWFECNVYHTHTQVGMHSKRN